MKMNRFQMLIEAALNESYTEDIMPLLRGTKIPDLGGTSENGWTTKGKYKKGTKLILIQLEADPEHLDMAQQDNATVIIAKYPGGIDQSLLQDKMNDFTREVSTGSKFGISYTTISPRDIANISNEELKKNWAGKLTYRDWRRIAGISDDAAKESKEVKRSKYNGPAPETKKLSTMRDPSMPRGTSVRKGKVVRRYGNTVSPNKENPLLAKNARVSHEDVLRQKAVAKAREFMAQGKSKEEAIRMAKKWMATKRQSMADEIAKVKERQAAFIRR
jgi:uncharacterized protein YoaH (UPF0181 family)